MSTGSAGINRMCHWTSIIVPKTSTTDQVVSRVEWESRGELAKTPPAKREPEVARI